MLEALKNVFKKEVSDEEKPKEKKMAVIVNMDVPVEQFPVEDSEI